ncbi:hypothetical protein GPECTOR_2g1141 [Gonium pectorale]|uniref:Enoyl reductase (ER) domain-containing protein n=1 Tax=Gonium pectorale TaxID=33097 RepID=A0A150H0H7_GONPE|nr:hypothetical protein GPECTOR_2g1141 [Gonium pectorale]|eukprot:KXZ55591.1 hypothetical protein GPECTOR_2g1141 [Gonium pectorale]
MYDDAYYRLQLLDLDDAGLRATASSLANRHPAGPSAVRTGVLNVTDSAAQADAFQAHVAAFGGVQLVVLNAGIGERGDVFNPSNAGWQATLDVDLTAVLHGVRAAAELMTEGGAILTVASAGAVFPMPVAPVYAAAKAGVAHFVRSAARTLASRRPPVRLLALCPEFVETPLVTKLMQEASAGQTDDPTKAKRLLGRLDIQLLPPRRVAEAGAVVLIVITTLSPNYRQAARLVTTKRLYGGSLVAAPPPGTLFVRRVFAGVNASDINYSSGRYHANRAEAESKLPFDAGFESVNVVVAVGEGVQGFAPGDCMAALSYGSFSEYGIEPARTALPVPRVAPEVVALLTSGLTASIALEEAGRIKAGETVLVTAAAGGTGQFAVQLAKAAGCKVVATCGGPDKARLLKELGADRIIDYSRESVKEVLKREFPGGVDVVYESVGGEMFEVAVNALAPRGRLVIIGMMSAYGSGWAPGNYPGLAEKLLWKSAAAVGFFLLRYAPLFRTHLTRLVQMWEAGRLRVALDPRVFVGVEAVFEAVEHLHSGRSVGKVVVQMPTELPSGVRGVAAAAAAAALVPASRL